MANRPSISMDVTNRQLVELERKFAATLSLFDELHDLAGRLHARLHLIERDLTEVRAGLNPHDLKDEHPKGWLAEHSVRASGNATGCYYIVLEHPEGLTGIYKSYQDYAEAVRDHSFPWNGRQSLQFVRGSVSHKLRTLSEGIAEWEGHHDCAVVYRY